MVHNPDIDDIRVIKPVRENYSEQLLSKTDVVPYIHFYEINTIIEKYEDKWTTMTTFLGYTIELDWEITDEDNFKAITAGGLGWDTCWSYNDVEGKEWKLLNSLHMDIIREYQKDKLYSEFGHYITRDEPNKERKPDEEKNPLSSTTFEKENNNAAN